MIYGALLAGGVGSRMNIESMPKQFLPLGTKPVFLHTLEKFCLCSRFDAIYLGVHKDWVDFACDVIDQASLPDIPIRVVCGGTDRNGTIMSVIDAIEAEFGVGADDCIVTHDSVRPFVKLSTIEANIDAVLEHGACDTVIPATDTIVRSTDGLLIESIPPRGEMYQGQTPQSFKIKAFVDHYRSLSDAERAILTDACKVFMMRGDAVALVPGDVINIKLTTIMDYKVAQALVESGQA